MTDLKKQVGDLIRDTRVAKKLSQRDLAAITGLGIDRISRYENGKSNPTLETIQEIAKALDVTFVMICQS